MRLWIIIPVFTIIFAFIFVMGMAVGYYLALSLMNKIALLAIGAFGFAFIAWVGSGADLLGLLREWYKDKKEEEKTPNLKYGSLVFTESHEPTGGEDYNTFRYYLKIIMSSGLGMATGCHAFIDVPQQRIRHLSPSWENGNVREISIGDEENLLLFTVYSYKDSKKIFWLSSSDYFEEKGEYNNIKNYTLNVKLIANGKVPKHPFSEKIEDIVNRAKQE